MALVLLDCAQHTDAHLVSAAIELQPFLMLRADLAVQVADFIHQLVSLEGSVLMVGLQVLLAVRGQAHEAGLDGLLLAPDTDVTAYIPGAGKVIVRGWWSRRGGLGVPIAGRGVVH